MAIEPVTREERFLAAAGGQSVTPPAPITRKEQLLQGIIDAVKSGGATPDVIEGAINDYLNANPVQPGATTEQAAQIEQNKTDIADLQTEVDELKESGGNGSGQNPTVTATAIDYDQNVRAINHRGYNTVAPENTLPAFILSKKNGFRYVEADISFTSDAVPVLLHDSAIDRVSNGTGGIYAMTYEEVSQYDFGSWKSAEYEGTKIPTFEDFILLCKKICLHPYIELKNPNIANGEQHIRGLVATVKKYGMGGKVTWISSYVAYLGYVKAVDPDARLGLLSFEDVSADTIASANSLKSDSNEVFLDVNYANLTDAGVQLCIDAGVPLEVYTVNTNAEILSLNPYITGVTSDSVIAGKVLYEDGLTTSNTGTGGGSGNDSEPGGDSGGDSGETDTINRGNLLHNWDLTNSVVDTVAGATLTLSANGITQDENGLTISDASGYAFLFENDTDVNDVIIDLDIASIDRQGAAHGRFVTAKETANGGYTQGFIYRSTGVWAAYDVSNNWTESGETNPAAFNGKTVSVKINADATASVYVDDALFFDGFKMCSGQNILNVCIGSKDGNSLFNCVITAIRVYSVA